MKSVSLAALLVLVAAAGASPQDPKPNKPQKIALKQKTFKKGELLRGLELAADPPLEARTAKVGPLTLAFFDLNGDGALHPDDDGLALPPYPFVVPLPETLLLPTGQFDVSFNGMKEIVLARQDLGAAEPMVRDASLITELRIRAGVRPARLDAATCADCLKHCDYLQANGLADGSGGMAAHNEDPGRPAYTPEGAAAGKNSNIGFGAKDLRAHIVSWYSTPWHGCNVVRPGLIRFATALKHDVALLYFVEWHLDPKGTTVHPPDGATGVMRSFSEFGEMPNPVPGTEFARGCGFPIIAQLTDPQQELTAAVVTDAAGRTVKGTFSSPPRPANPDWPTNSGLAVFIPSAPLAANTQFTVRFEFRDATKPLVWSFTTGR